MSYSLQTYSKFYYGYRITAEPYNGYIDINEGSGEIGIELPVGSYTLNEFVDIIRSSLLAQGTLDYTVTANRATRIITITADSAFSILSNTGSHVGSSAYSLMGFKTSSDYSSSTSHVGILPSGSCFYPQFLLQSYVPSEHWQSKNEASVNVASSGTSVEVVNFGIAKFIQADIKFITDIPMDGVVIKNNQSGVSDAVDFLKYITNKNYFEFIPDVNDPDVFEKVLLESTPDFNDGTGFKLKELYDKNLPGVYETGVMVFRVVD